jgi:protein-L-isoaspartate(D-aspartate) O-methyltransferase
MSGLDTRAAVFQQRLVDQLRSRGVGDPAILDAFAAIPRHRFVDRFRVAQPEPDAHGSSLQRVVDNDADDDVLELVYAADLALLTDEDATSSLSAPYLIAGMLRELDMRPGMRVLEIGAGSGYHAALLATLVGDPDFVTTVDIHSGLVEQARVRLTALGLGGITVVADDGNEGITGARFDRIVATVGCNDIAPAWLEQLDADGALLVPLVHGAAHPRVRLTDDDDVLGTYTGYSGFVGIRGRQAGHSPWAARASTVPKRSIVRELPTYVAAALAPPDPARPRWNPAEWALGFYVALRDRRASLAGLDDGDSFARVERATLVLGGAHGEALGADLAALAESWLDLGAPGLERYETAFSPEPFGMPALSQTGSRAGPWTIRRLRHSQRVELGAE